MTRLASFVAAFIVSASLSGAHAAVQVIGNGPEHQCYQASKTGRSDRKALEACTQALQNSPLSASDRAATHVNRSVLLLATKNPRAALADTDSALSIDPALVAASVNRAAALIRLERYAEARATLDRALPMATGFELTRGLFNRAVASEALGDLTAAYEDFRRIVELDPGFEDARTELARFQVQRR